MKREANHGAVEPSIDYASTYEEALQKAYLEASKLSREVKERYPTASVKEKIEYKSIDSQA